MPTSLPNQLAYLAPVLAQLEKFDPDALGDDNPDAMDIVTAALKKRVAGMDEEAAEEALKGDGEALQAWLEQSSEAADSPAGYIYGVMIGIGMYGDIGELLG